MRQTWVNDAAEPTASAPTEVGSMVDVAPCPSADPQQAMDENNEDSVSEEEVSNIEAMDEASGKPIVCEKQEDNQSDTRTSLQAVDIQARSVQENARLLLDAPEQIGFEPLLELSVQMIAQSPSRIVEAAALLQCLAESPQHGDRTHQFYRVFQQCIQQPGRSYRFNSQEINDQQSYIVPIEGLSFAVPLHGLYQAMVLTNLLWAMVFPSTAYDHSLYNNADMVWAMVWRMCWARRSHRQAPRGPSADGPQGPFLPVRRAWILCKCYQQFGQHWRARALPARP